MSHRSSSPWLLIGLGALAVGCDGVPAASEQTNLPVPAGWRETVVLAGGDGREAVIAALPRNLLQTTESGIENQISSYSAPGLIVRFDYGAEAHPGCERGASRCRLEDRSIAGRAGKVSTSSSAGAGSGTTHHYFVPLPDPAARSSPSSTLGSGLLITVRCSEEPTCRLADQIARHIRFADRPAS